ncbi:MAG: helix-turn-helix domain-containing protein [Oscillospiraceae bacterium]|nr:helix-turn-helix domain-containing protein [Oscillospiraceae bacterium]
MISYAPFWETLKQNKLTAYQLMKYDKISSNTIHRLRHNLPIDTKTLNKLCKALECYSISEVIEYERD